MLKPKDFNYKADKVTAYYNDFEDYLLRDIAKFLLNADGVGGKADRELFILQQMGLSQDEITERLAQLTAQSEEAVKEVLQESVMTSFSNDKEVLDKYFSGDYGPLNNPAIRQTMDAEWAKTCGELDNLTRTTLGAYNDTVIKSLNEAEVLCASGAVSYSEAVANVLDKLAMSGLMLDYPTGAHRSLEAAVRCAVVTSMNQTAAQVTNQYIAEGGIEYVLVSAHTGARISDKGGLYSHAEWQGRAYKIRGSEDGYPNLLEATGYDIDPSTGNGQVVNPNGLHGYNCRHSHQPWDKELDNPWVDDQGNLKVDAEEQKYIQDKQSVIDERIARIQADENYSDKQKERLIAAEEKRRNTCKYEDMQTQRRMESQIRDTKRQIVMKDAELDNVKHDTDLFVQLMGDRRNLEHKLTNRNRVYGQYCADFGLTQQRDRLKVAGYTRKNKSVASNSFTKQSLKSDISKKESKKLKKRKQIDTGFKSVVPDDELDAFNKKALDYIKQDTGYSESEALKLQKALQEYFGGDYNSIIAAKSDDVYNEYTKVIIDGLKKMPKYDGTIYRGMCFQEYSADIFNLYKELKVGDDLPAKGMLSSWSSEKAVANSYSGFRDKGNSVILVCENESGVGVQHLSKFGKREAEVLSSANYEVTDTQILDKYKYLQDNLDSLEGDDHWFANEYLEDELETNGDLICIIKVKEKN